MPEVPGFSLGKHHRKDTEHAVWLIGDMSQPVMEPGNIRALNRDHLRGSNLRNDKQVHATLVFLGGAWLTVEGHILSQEAIAECSNPLLCELS